MKIAAAFVFGSLVVGSETTTSEVDVFVVGEVGFAEVVAALSPLRERLGRELNPVVMTPGDFAAHRVAGERFVERVMGEPKLFRWEQSMTLDNLLKIGELDAWLASNHPPLMP